MELEHSDFNMKPIGFKMKPIVDYLDSANPLGVHSTDVVDFFEQLIKIDRFNDIMMNANSI